jgi:hypothetical protein
LLSHVLGPIICTMWCLFMPFTCFTISHLHPACPTRAPSVPKGNVYLLGAAGHQALLQPESLLLGACLGVVVPHQAPLDLEMTEWVRSELEMWATLSLLPVPPCLEQHPTPSARRPRCARGHCGRLGRCHSRERT